MAFLSIIGLRMPEKARFNTETYGLLKTYNG